MHFCYYLLTKKKNSAIRTMTINYINEIYKKNYYTNSKIASRLNIS